MIMCQQVEQGPGCSVVELLVAGILNVFFNKLEINFIHFINT